MIPNIPMLSVVISLPPFVIYLLFCLAIALAGRNRKFGFTGYLLCSLILSPLVGALLVCVSDPRPVDDYENE